MTKLRSVACLPLPVPNFRLRAYAQTGVLGMKPTESALTLSSSHSLYCTLLVLGPPTPADIYKDLLQLDEATSFRGGYPLTKVFRSGGCLPLPFPNLWFVGPIVRSVLVHTRPLLGHWFYGLIVHTSHPTALTTLRLPGAAPQSICVFLSSQCCSLGCRLQYFPWALPS